MVRVVVVTTVLNGEEWIGRCLDSVREQEGVENLLHYVIDAASDDRTCDVVRAKILEYNCSDNPNCVCLRDEDERRSALENVYRVVRGLEDDDIVVWVDADDWLPTPEVLAYIHKLHAAGYWVTYGQFIWRDGRIGFAAPYQSTHYRREPWLATHLKTFRAGLFKLIALDDFKHEGKWIEHAYDQAVMFPLMEMAGPKRIAAVSRVLYLYNEKAHWNQSGEDRRLSEEASRVIRKKKPYPMIEAY